jgi:Lon protease-like protein
VSDDFNHRRTFGKSPQTGYNADMTRIDGLPLFPLNTVLFPGQLLPLHIFEPRYRLMISECLTRQSPFGVVLIRDGNEIGGEGAPFDVGTTARIEQAHRLDDGRMNILCIGQSRFKVARLHHHRPYLSGDADLWPWEPLVDEIAAEPRSAHIRQLLTAYLRQLAKATGNTVQLDDMPSEPAPLANLAAIVLQIPNREKQHLLAAPSVDLLVDDCIHLLERENRALKIAAALPLAANEGSMPFSQN